MHLTLSVCLSACLSVLRLIIHVPQLLLDVSCLFSFEKGMIETRAIQLTVLGDALPAEHKQNFKYTLPALHSHQCPPLNIVLGTVSFGTMLLGKLSLGTMSP